MKKNVVKRRGGWWIVGAQAGWHRRKPGFWTLFAFGFAGASFRTPLLEGFQLVSGQHRPGLTMLATLYPSWFPARFRLLFGLSLLALLSVIYVYRMFSSGVAFAYRRSWSTAGSYARGLGGSQLVRAPGGRFVKRMPWANGLRRAIWARRAHA